MKMCTQKNALLHNSELNISLKLIQGITLRRWAIKLFALGVTLLQTILLGDIICYLPYLGGLS